MEDLVKTARLYYSKSSPKVKEAARNFFNSLDDNKDGKVSLSEFLRLMRQEGHTKMGNRHFFKELDKDGSGTLEFMEVMALYYVIKSGRPFCSWCDEFIPGIYFTCSKCFGVNSFCVCPKCFEDKLLVHEHDQFLDNYALLEAKRLEGIANHSNQHKPSSSVTISTKLDPTSTTNAVVPYEHKPRPWDRRLRILETAIGTAVGNLCTILGFTYSSPSMSLWHVDKRLLNHRGGNGWWWTKGREVAAVRGGGDGRRSGRGVAGRGGWLSRSCGQAGDGGAEKVGARCVGLTVVDAGRGRRR
ncbi:hypothetical protein RHSIM_Rhsim02G0045100 [Rhododendron simsii]|uniref:EF-hand domain-containing protein n=1 Tax=Rhododendron simsii TaxID=118357 RepID=A0A834LZG0_RHOSS|nr:hypothetical protein RHSIM_Rhsim02G0045100 [Rhododendron simsii]